MAPEALDRVQYRGEPRMVLFADSDEALERQRREAERIGCSIAAMGAIEGAAERIDEQIHLDALLIEAERPSLALDRLLDRADAAARTGRYRSVVTGSVALIDTIAARAGHRDVQHLCRPTPIDRVLALITASVRPKLRLRDGKEDMHAVLQQLSDEVARIASVLSNLAEDEARGEGDEAEAGGKEGATIDAGLIRSIIRARRLRDRYFRGGLFARRPNTLYHCVGHTVSALERAGVTRSVFIEEAGL